ncbi:MULTISPECIES: efflux RND transporter periplasmic adaptor subunit [Azorhizobium]|uniref:efflux RND transporter periplasmic adaptor subunit n=1 Tax=Azorhizobium TaxID=6 RepID=UPI0010615FA4|nr:efflux RND transporter periplasmic adaptor subunit [Azorhizobium sp. AG788]TDT94587.1 RND family efflux transporter MFP subunit [Azorhizobium sp. AG788]
MGGAKRTGRWRFYFLFLCLVAAGGAGWAWSQGLIGKGGGTAKAQSQPERRVAVVVATAQDRPMPVRIEALGTVEPQVTVTIRSRVASQVTSVAFEDGAVVNKGDLLFQLDPREVDAQILQARATLAKDKTQLEKALRDMERYSGLAARNTVSQVTLDDARTTADAQKATVDQDEANLKALEVQRSHYDIRSPVSGRLGVSAVRPGAVIRVDDTLATVRQIKPIYVAFGVPEHYLRDIRAAQNDAKVEIALQGSKDVVGDGRISVIDNTVDPQTGTLMVRAVFENADERLWPGTLGAVSVTLRMESGVVSVPAEAVQSGQSGTFVFVVENDTAHVRPVTMARTVDGYAVITAGLKGGEVVVTDGQLSLREGSRVSVKGAAASTPAPGA